MSTNRKSESSRKFWTEDKFKLVSSQTELKSNLQTLSSNLWSPKRKDKNWEIKLHTLRPITKKIYKSWELDLMLTICKKWKDSRGNIILIFKKWKDKALVSNKLLTNLILKTNPYVSSSISLRHTTKTLFPCSKGNRMISNFNWSNFKKFHKAKKQICKTILQPFTNNKHVNSRISTMIILERWKMKLCPFKLSTRQKPMKYNNLFEKKPLLELFLTTKMQGSKIKLQYTKTK